MNLWMIVTPDVWQELQQKKSLVMRTRAELEARDEEARPEWTGAWYPQPYEWIADQMRDRLTGQHGERLYPWMAYWQFRKGRQKPDMRSARHWFKNAPHTLLHLDVPYNRVLLLHDDALVPMMNGKVVVLNESEYDHYYGVNAEGEHTLEPSHSDVMETWYRALDLNLLQEFGDPAWVDYRGGTIWGMFGELRLHDVLSVRHYPKTLTDERSRDPKEWLAPSHPENTSALLQ